MFIFILVADIIIQNENNQRRRPALSDDELDEDEGVSTFGDDTTSELKQREKELIARCKDSEDDNPQKSKDRVQTISSWGEDVFRHIGRQWLGRSKNGT